MTETKIFPSTFSRAMLLNCSMVLEFCSLGMKTATALCHCDGMVCLVQAVFIRVHRCFSTLGQFLYSLYGIPFGPGADADLARQTTRLISQSLGGEASKSTDGSPGFGT